MIADGVGVAGHRRRVGQMQGRPIGAAAVPVIVVRRTGVPDIEQPARGSGQQPGQPAAVGVAPAEQVDHRVDPRQHGSPPHQLGEVPADRRARRRPAQHRPERGVRPLPGHPRVEHQQRRPVAPGVPFGGRPRRVHNVGGYRHQHLDQFHQPMPIGQRRQIAQTPRDLGRGAPGGGDRVLAGAHQLLLAGPRFRDRQQPPGHPGQPRAGRDEQHRSRRRHTFGQQLPARAADQQHAQDVGEREFGVRCGEGPRAQRAADGGTPILGVVRLGQRGGELLQGGQQQRFLHHPGDGPLGLPDDPQAGVGGDAEVGVAQYQCQPAGFGHGHVDQAGSSAVTARP
ncbi:hypothetical protein PICSAR35_03844 [Mycobacterium avium subsp. paratuberculosis]|nr:hypothetical protein PICSAR35_03844 [Mycobacterium avium subsp. paratuberculosis]